MTPNPAAVIPRIVLPAVALAVLLAIASGPARADDAADDARQMHHRIEQLHQLLRERQQLRDQHETQMQTLRDQVERLEADHRHAQSELAEREQQVNQIRQRVEQLQTSHDALAQQIAAAAERATPVADAMRQRIATGVPFRRESRQQAVVTAYDALADIDEPLSQGEGLSALWSAAEEDLQLSRAIRYWNEPATIADGRRVQAYQVRIGLVQQMLISEDGRVIGLASHDPQQPWRLDLSPEQARQVRDAAGVLRQQQPPELIPIPLPATGEIGAGE